MKRLLSLLLLFNWTFSDAGVLSSHRDTLVKMKESIVFERMSAKYTDIITYTSKCYWPTRENYLVLVKSQDSWKAYAVNVFYKDRKKTSENIKKIKSKRIHANADSVAALLVLWKNLNFYVLRNDSLNKSYIIHYDSLTKNETIESMHITDGCTDRFEIRNDRGYYILSAYEPEHFQKSIPVLQRQIFIICRDKFIELFY